LTQDAEFDKNIFTWAEIAKMDTEILQNMKKLASLAVSIVFLGAINSFGTDAPKTNPYHVTLATVPSAELPAKAADLVKQAKAQERKTIVTDVVQAAVALNPAAAPAIVGAVARAVPEVAALAAGVAAAEQPKQAAAITRAAAAAAPAKVGEIVLAVCRAVPNEYRGIAIAAAQSAPGSGKLILEAVASALAPLQPGIQQALVGYGGNPPSVAVVLDSVRPTATSASAATPPAPVLVSRPAPMPISTSRGGGLGPPYIPLSGTPTNVTSGTSGDTGPGERNYASP
jgi:hypothetical protein